uniref:Transmembrane protein adipocyte-associated 1 n=1 Tax=Araucaria cunninghamii TaxID=56994 RepID=A0A0D6QX44_ARACU
MMLRWWVGDGEGNGDGNEYGYGIWYNAALVIPPLGFVLFLLWQIKSSIHKLRQNGSSYIVASCYGFLWLVSILNLLWCILQAWQGVPGQATAFNVLSLVTRFGMLLLEISVVVFLLQGNHASGLNALLHALVLSSIIAGIDALIKAICIFGFGIPLFVDGNDVGDLKKWDFWLVHNLLLVAVYGSILYLPHTKWRNRLPAKPTFYNYIRVMFLLNTTSALGCGLLSSGVGFGYWIYGFTNICYHAFYPPFLYVTFLRDFFQEEDLHLQDVYYSEMKDAGFFDADWD